MCPPGKKSGYTGISLAHRRQTSLPFFFKENDLLPLP
jgi:hypothetical protein